MDILSSSGINNMIETYRYSESYKRVDPLETKKTKFSNLSSAWGTLDTNLSSLKSLLDDFRDPDVNTIFGSKSVQLSNEDYFTATATTSSSNSSYNIGVSQMAKSDLVMSDTLNSDNISGLSAGSYSFRVKSGEFDETISVDISGGERIEELMELVSDAINDATAETEVTASVFSPKNGESKLSLVATESGETNAITIEDISGSLLSSIGMDFSDRTLASGTTGGYTNTADELNANITLNGIDIVRDSNTIDDLISGVTISLKEEMAEGVPTVNLMVENNIEAIRADLDEFIEKFNESYMYVKDNYKSTEDGDRGVFVGNSSALAITQKFSQISTLQVEGLTEGNLSYLSQIGIEFDTKTGLSITDSDDLEDALTNNADEVAALFNSENGIANQLYDFVENYVSDDGVISSMTNTYDKTVSYLGDKITKQEENIDKGALVLRHQYEAMQMQLIALYENQNYFNSLGIF